MSPRGREAPSWFSTHALHAEISKKQSTQSTMKQGVKEHMIRHKQILKKVNFKDTEKVKLKNSFSRKGNEKTPGNYVRRRYFYVRKKQQVKEFNNTK